MNNSATSRDIQFLQEAAEKIASLNASPSVNVPVQEGDVSSSNPPILATELFGSALQELKGFLFVVNSQGKIVSVTDNITHYLGYQPSEWPDASIYDFLHVTNHASFSQNILSPLGGSDGKSRIDSKNVLSPFRCRMRHGSGHSDCSDRRREEDSLVHIQISSLPYRIERLSSTTSSLTGSQMYLICVAQKVDDPLALWTQPVSRINRRFTQPQLIPAPLPISSTKSSARVHFTMHLNIDWVIQACDFSGMGPGNDLSNRFVGNKFTSFVHNNDLTLFQKYSDSVVKGGSEQHSSNIYRFKLTDTRNVFVHSRAQLTTLPNLDGHQHIHSKHSIVRDCDPSELKGSAASSLMKAIIHSQSQSSTAALDSGVSSRHQSIVEQAGGNFGLSSGNQYPPVQPGARDRHLYQPTGLVQQPNNSLGNTMMSGVPQTPDLNFNDLYSSRMGGGVNFDVYENGFNWVNSSAPQMLPQQPPVHNRQTHHMRSQNSSHLLQQGMTPMQTDMNGLNLLDSKSTVQTLPSYTTSYQSTTPQMSQSTGNGKLRELLSSVVTPNDIIGAEAASLSPTSRKSPSSHTGHVLRKLLQADNEDDLMSSISLPYTLTPQAVTLNSISTITSHADSNTLVVSPSTSTSSKVSEQHHLLKKLLSEESQVDDGDKAERNGILQKLFKDAEKEVVRKSPPTSSPGGSSVDSGRRHSSGGSSKDSKFQADAGRGTKRKIGPATVTSTAPAIAEPDSTATSNTTLLNHLLTKPLDTATKVDPHEITATPLEKIKAHRTKTIQSSNVIDVVNNKIMHGTEQIDMERFTAMVRTSESSMYQRQNSGGYTNGALYPNNQQGQLLNAMDTGLPHSDMTMANNYLSNDSKDFFSNGMGHTLPVQQQTGPTRIPPPMHFSHPVKRESMDSDRTASMLQHLLNPDSDNLIIQELENLLGGGNTSMQLTSPEDERAIKDIEKQLLYGTESLCPNKSFTNNTSEPHSPGFSLGLTNVPASASNPVRAANYNIHHKPQISSSHNLLPYENQQQSNQQLHHALRGHLTQQQPAMPRTTSMSSSRPNLKAVGRQGSGSGRSMSQTADGKIRRRSGNSPSGSLSSFSPLANGPIGQNMQNNYTIPTNFGELMKSTVPPNVKLPQDLNSNTFPPRSSDMMRHELTSPRTSRPGPPSFPPSPMDVSSSPQHFRFPDQYSSGSRSMMQRPMMGGLVNGSYHPDQLNILSNQQSMANTNDLGSPQGLRVGQLENATSGLSVGQSNLQPYSNVDQLSSNTVTNSQYVKQEMKARITARAQKQITSPQHQNFSNQQHVMSSQQMTMMSPPSARQSILSNDPFANQFVNTSMPNDRGHEIYQDSVLPDDILDQITELTHTQNEIQQQHQMEAMANSLSNDNSMVAGDNSMVTNENAMVPNDHDMAIQKINQTKKESTELRIRLRALAGGTSSQPDGTLDKVFRNQLANSLTNKQTVKTSAAESMEMDKLKHHAQNTAVSVITVSPRAPIDEMQPNDQRNSILQQLLTTDPATS